MRATGAELRTRGPLDTEPPRRADGALGGAVIRGERPGRAKGAQSGAASGGKRPGEARGGGDGACAARGATGTGETRARVGSVGCVRVAPCAARQGGRRALSEWDSKCAALSRL